MLKIARVLFLASIMILCLGISVAAQDDETSEEIYDFMSAFDLSERDLGFESDDYSGYGEFMYFEEAYEEDTNVFGSFSFSGGLSREKFSTFSCKKSLIGYGDEDTSIGLLVYYEEADRLVAVDVATRVLGASGLYNEEICFEENRVQYLVVAVEDQYGVHHRVFEVTTKEEATRSLLENLQIKFIIEEEPETIEFEMPMVEDLEF